MVQPKSFSELDLLQPPTRAAMRKRIQEATQGDFTFEAFSQSIAFEIADSLGVPQELIDKNPDISSKSGRISG